jgi:hypothetical protein
MCYLEWRKLGFYSRGDFDDDGKRYGRIGVEGIKWDENYRRSICEVL